MKEISLLELLDTFAPLPKDAHEVALERRLAMNHGEEATSEAIRAKLTRMFEDPGTTSLVLFENHDLCSSRLGERKVLKTGTGCTYEQPSEVMGRWLNDLPSQRLYPVAYVRKPDTQPVQDERESRSSVQPIGAGKAELAVR